MLSKITTAEEFLKTNNAFSDEDVYLLKQDLKVNNILDINDISVTMIEFAKLHVEAAKKEYLQQGFGRYMEHPFDKYPTRVPTDEDSILNAYPLENVK